MQHMEPWGGDERSGEIKGAHSLRLLMQTVGGGCAGRLWKVGLGAMFKLELEHCFGGVRTVLLYERKSVKRSSSHRTSHLEVWWCPGRPQ